MAFGHGMSVLWPDRRQGVFTGDWGRLCRWEVRASARRGERRGRDAGGGGYPGTLDLLPPFLGMDTGVDQFLRKQNDGWNTPFPVFVPFRCRPCLSPQPLFAPLPGRSERCCEGTPQMRLRPGISKKKKKPPDKSTRGPLRSLLRARRIID